MERPHLCDLKVGQQRSHIEKGNALHEAASPISLVSNNGDFVRDLTSSLFCGIVVTV